MIKIPKVIHFIWIGPNLCPYSQNIASYRLHNPNWRIKIWDNNNLPDIKNKWLYERMTSWAAKADVLRLEILYNEGGIYTDCDSICLRSLDSLVDNLECFGMQGNGGGVQNAFMGATPKHPAFEKIVYGLESHAKELAKTKVNKKKGTSVFRIAGWRYITPILRADPTYTQLDEGCEPGERKLLGTIRDHRVFESGYVVQYNDGSWWNEKALKRIKL